MTKKKKRKKKTGGIIDAPDPNVHMPEAVKRKLAAAELLYEYVHGSKTFEDNFHEVMNEIRNVVEKLTILGRTIRYRMIKDHKND